MKLNQPTVSHGIFRIFIYLFIYCLFRAAPVAYGGSQARGPIGAVATGLHHSHGKAGLNPRPHGY